jgi:5,10-methylenetetrahydromethanopterin reductase
MSGPSPGGAGTGPVASPPGRIALYLQDKHAIRDGMRWCRRAESAGFEAVWQAESRLVREATVPMAAFAAVTERLLIGSGVVNTWTRNVALLASTFVTLDDLAPGRVILGLGAWWDPLARKVGITRARPLRAMRETVEACRALFTLRETSYTGDFVYLDGVRIDVVHGDDSPRQIPIYIGATGPKMLELTGEIADGVVLNYMVSPSYNDGAMARLAAGAARSGRTLDDIDRPQLVVCSLDSDRSKALDAARLLLTQYLGQQPHIMRASGVDSSLIEEINAIVDWPATHDEIAKAAALVPDEVVQLVSASGTPDECRAKVAEYVAHGATCPILYPLGDDVEAMIEAFGAQGAAT